MVGTLQKLMRRLPRADGDGPSAAAFFIGVAEAPPCRRGWTRPVVVVGRRVNGSPVQTGMDRRRAPDRAPTPRLPRADGDGPWLFITRNTDRLAPPCRRGWTPKEGRSWPGRAGSPVQTGMDLNEVGVPVPVPWLPRADGDGPMIEGWTDQPKQAPPCRRGWTLRDHARRVVRLGSPVQTGMDRPAHPHGLRGHRLPRADGDGPTGHPLAPGAVWAPPCRRGWTVRVQGVPAARRGSPVQTGMDPPGGQPRVEGVRLPRADGDGPPEPNMTRPYFWAPPCRRGWTRQAPAGVGLHGGSPVQTGMDP